jgi:hypothetical protein
VRRLDAGPVADHERVPLARMIPPWRWSRDWRPPASAHRAGLPRLAAGTLSFTEQDAVGCDLLSQIGTHRWRARFRRLCRVAGRAGQWSVCGLGLARTAPNGWKVGSAEADAMRFDGAAQMRIASDGRALSVATWSRVFRLLRPAASRRANVAGGGFPAWTPLPPVRSFPPPRCRRWSRVVEDREATCRLFSMVASPS